MNWKHIAHLSLAIAVGLAVAKMFGGVFAPLTNTITGLASGLTNSSAAPKSV
jgi:hypothetical protein